MLGDILDVKRALKDVLQGSDFADMVQTVFDEKRAQGEMFPHPFSLRGPEVQEEEKMSPQLFPLCELIGYQTTYEMPDQMVKQATHRIGIRWTALHDHESHVTKLVETLCTATVNFVWNEEFAGYLNTHAEVNAGSSSVVEEDYSPLMPDERKAFLKSGLVIVLITTYRS